VHIRAVSVGLVTLVAAACGSSESSGRPLDEPLSIVVTTDIWADVVGNVVCGAGPVVQLLPSGADPHGYEASLADRGALEDAALVVTNGLGLEGSLADTLDAVDDVPVFVMADHIDTIPLLGGAGDGDGDGDDPHVWTDPVRVASALPSLVDALVSAGFQRPVIEQCADLYIDRLTDLDAEITAMVGAIPADRRLLVTGHESLGYFADRYDFAVVGAVIEGGSSLGAANPAALAELADAIDATDVPAVFVDPNVSSDDAEVLAERAGVEVVGLPVETLTIEVATYVDLLRVVAERITAALNR
jgi:zinc/manganese transport system substrate-binding protein